MLDIKANRRSRNYSWQEYTVRILWVFGSVIFRWMPRHFWFVKNVILRIFGATVGKQTRIESSAYIKMPWNVVIGDYCAIGEEVHVYSLGKVCIGDRVTISQQAYICAGSHDLQSNKRELLKPGIFIKDDVWVAARGFIGPGIILEEGSVIGAGAVVFSNVDAHALMVGNPATVKRMIND